LLSAGSPAHAASSAIVRSSRFAVFTPHGKSPVIAFSSEFRATAAHAESRIAARSSQIPATELLVVSAPLSPGAKQAGGLPLGAFIGIGCFGLLIVCAILAAILYRHRPGAVDSYSPETQEATIESDISFTAFEEPMSMDNPLTNEADGSGDMFDDHAETEGVTPPSSVIWNE
jgi:hypothetical protein